MIAARCRHRSGTAVAHTGHREIRPAVRCQRAGRARQRVRDDAAAFRRLQRQRERCATAAELCRGPGGRVDGRKRKLCTRTVDALGGPQDLTALTRARHVTGLQRASPGVLRRSRDRGRAAVVESGRPAAQC